MRFVDQIKQLLRKQTGIINLVFYQLYVVLIVDICIKIQDLKKNFMTYSIVIIIEKLCIQTYYLQKILKDQLLEEMKY